MNFTCLLQSPSGSSPQDYAFLGQRFEEGRTFQLGTVDTWLLQRQGAASSVREGTDGWLTMVWRSSTGIDYITEAEKGLHIVRPGAARSGWQSVPVPGMTMGVWGLDDANVYVWSLTATGGLLFRWDGQALQEMPSPGKVVRLHGIGPQALMAVGQEGLLARWNGQGWQKFPLPTRETFTGVFMPSADEFWACGQFWTLVEGSAFGCRMRAAGPGPLYDVAVWGGEVWVAAREFGLLRLRRNSPVLEAVEPDLPALSFDARGALLIGCSENILSTLDGKSFSSQEDGFLAQATASRPPLWLRPRALRPLP